jgi:hypothetical protein
MLVLLAVFTFVASLAGRTLFGSDPMAGFIEEHSAAWCVLKLTSACTLCLMLAAALLERPI